MYNFKKFEYHFFKGTHDTNHVFSLETPMPAAFIAVSPLFCICNRNPSFTCCRFNLLGNTNTSSDGELNLLKTNTTTREMTDYLFCGRRSPRSDTLANCALIVAWVREYGWLPYPVPNIL